MDQNENANAYQNRDLVTAYGLWDCIANYITALDNEAIPVVVRSVLQLSAKKAFVSQNPLPGHREQDKDANVTPHNTIPTQGMKVPLVIITLKHFLKNAYSW